MLHDGYLFEVGADGYGYIIDETEPGQSYPIQVERIGGLPNPVIDLEGCKVTFYIENKRVENAMLASRTLTATPGPKSNASSAARA